MKSVLSGGSVLAGYGGLRCDEECAGAATVGGARDASGMSEADADCDLQNRGRRKRSKGEGTA